MLLKQSKANTIGTSKIAKAMSYENLHSTGWPRCTHKMAVKTVCRL